MIYIYLKFQGLVKTFNHRVCIRMHVRFYMRISKSLDNNFFPQFLIHMIFHVHSVIIISKDSAIGKYIHNCIYNDVHTVFI